MMIMSLHRSSAFRVAEVMTRLMTTTVTLAMLLLAPSSSDAFSLRPLRQAWMSPLPMEQQQRQQPQQQGHLLPLPMMRTAATRHQTHLAMSSGGNMDGTDQQPSDGFVSTSGVAHEDQEKGGVVVEAKRETTTTTTPKVLVRNMNSGEMREINFVDPAMQANTNPLLVDWWAAVFFGLPVVLLLDDVFHFLPKDEGGGLSAFLLRFQ